MAEIPVIGSASSDPAKYLIRPSRFDHPRLSIVGGAEFVWPLGIEGATISGQARLAEHFYIGDNSAVLQVMHRDDRRIELTGQFPGDTGSDFMRDLLEIVAAETPDNGKILTLPGVFPKQQLVVIENYNFTHAEDDPTKSWDYTITFRRQGVGKKIAAPIVTPRAVVPGTNKAAVKKGKPSRVFTVHSGGNTLRAAAQIVFSNPNRWREIYNKNAKALKKLGVPLVQISTHRLPNGMKLYY